MYAHRVHELKCWQEYFPLMINGRKAFEIRRADRDYQAGDVLDLREWNKDLRQYTGNRAAARVIAVYHQLPGLEAGFCAMTIELERSLV
jgi:hypothetical protein